MKEKIHLALDTSGSLPLACLAKNTEILIDWTGQEGMKHHETLLEGIHQLFVQTELKTQDLDFLTIGIGPGLFTGLRIGITTAKFLAESLNIPCVAVSSLHSLLVPYSKSQQTIWAVGDARSGRIYYRSNQSLTDDDQEKIGFPDDLCALLKPGHSLCGEGASIYKEKWPQEVQLLEKPLSATNLALLGFQKFEKGDTLPPENVEAKYLKIDPFRYEQK